MSKALDLTPEEQLQLAAALETVVADTASMTSLNALLRDWKDFIRAIERGYGDSIYEYTNALSVRDQLAAVVDHSPITLRAKVSTAIEPLDERFETATEPAARPLKASGAISFWWTRIPIRRVGELADDLAALGHIS